MAQASRRLNRNRSVFTAGIAIVLLGISMQSRLGAQEIEESGFSSADLEPAVRIEQRENHKIEEFSVNDNVYMIRITPKYGAPYTLVDPNGSGEMEWRRDTLGAEVAPPQWTLFSW